MNYLLSPDTIHDLRSSLAVIRSMSEAQTLTAGSSHDDVFASIIEHVDRMHKILADLPSA